MNLFVLIPFLCYSYIQAAQSMSTRPLVPDTCNQVDATGAKQGYWIEFSGTKGSRSYKEARGFYLQNKKNKTWVEYSGDATTITKIENYSNGIKEGIFIELENGGIKKEEWYRADKLHGIIKTYSFGSRLSSETVYENGVLQGPKNTWYTNGKKQEESYYVQGKREGKATWYFEDGKKSIEYTYTQGNLNGPMKTYHKNEITATEGTYLNNELHGTFKEYYPDGKLKSEGSYLNGKKDGIWKEYNPQGELVLIQKFKDGLEKK